MDNVEGDLGVLASSPTRAVTGVRGVGRIGRCGPSRRAGRRRRRTSAELVRGALAAPRSTAPGTRARAPRRRRCGAALSAWPTVAETYWPRGPRKRRPPESERQTGKTSRDARRRFSLRALRGLGQGVELGFDDPVAGTGGRFESRALGHRDHAAAVADEPAVLQAAWVSDTVGRRTPSIWPRNSWVSGNEGAPTRSWVVNNHRARCSALWCRCRPRSARSGPSGRLAPSLVARSLHGLHPRPCRSRREMLDISLSSPARPE
jgi:hypothetical protein